MSSVLDQILMEDIARWCPQAFLEFHQCMSKDDTDCTTAQYNLAKCIKTQVPSFQKIQSVCAGKLQAYEACIVTNKGTERCKHELSQLRDCAFDQVGKK
ncbi:hypothetical protein DICA3_A09362 [Diutina catenulata]